MSDPVGRTSTDVLLEQAIAALNRGDVAEAHALADEVLATDADNADAAHLLETSSAPAGEIRRLTVVFCDLVGSTELSARMEPEAYHSVLLRYQDLCRAVLEDRYQGSIISFRGDGVLAAFGFPEAHEDDVDRAVQGSLDLLQAMERLSVHLVADTGAPLQARVAAHKGVVFLDRAQRDLYGFAVNVAARLEALAEPGTLVVSDEVRSFLGDHYVVESHPPREVKGVAQPLASHTVRAHRPRRSATSSAGPLIGRDDERATLVAAWQAARDGSRVRGSSVAVIGEAGIGKSRLVSELCLEAAVDGAAVIELAGSPLQTTSGLWPVRRLLEDRSDVTLLADGPERLRRLRDLVSGAGLDEEGVALLATLVGLDPSTGFDRVESDDRRLREQIEAAAIAYLRAGFGDQGTVVVVEDVHWMDAATRELVAQLTRLDDPHLLVVLSSRNPGDAPRGDLTTTVTLTPLDGPARMELIETLGGADLDADVVRHLVDRSDGVPLFVEELVQAARLGDRGSSSSFDTPTTRRTDVDTSVPDVLYESLVARLNVAPHVMDVAATAATIGRDVERGLLARACNMELVVLREALQVLLEGGILEPHRARPDDLRFHHELQRAVIDDLQPPARRRDLHRRVAEAMLADDVDRQALDWYVVAAHLEAAGDVPAAADAFSRASIAARRRGDLLESRAILSRAIDLVSASPLDLSATETDLLLRRGFLSVSLEGNTSAQAAVDYERCLELAVAGDDEDGLVATLTCLAAYDMAKGDMDRNAELYTALGQVTGRLQGIARFMAKTGEALGTFYRGQFDRAQALGEEAIAMGAVFEQTDAYDRWFFVPLDPVAANHGSVAIARFFQGDIIGWRAQMRSATAVASALPFPQGAFSYAGMLSFEVFLAVELGLLEDVERVLDELEEISARYGFDQWAIVATTARQTFGGSQAIERGADPSEILAYANTLGGYLNMWKMVDQWVFTTYYTTMQAQLYAAAGERDLALAAYDESLAIGERTRMRFYDAETLRLRALLHEDPVDRIAGLRAALDLALSQHAVMFELRITHDLHRETGDDGPLRVAVAKFPPSASFGLLDATRNLVSGS